MSSKLIESARRFTALADDPQPGLSTWHEQTEAAYQDIKAGIADEDTKRGINEACAIRAAYKNAEPKQHGDLHERMKYLMEQCEGAGIASSHTALWRAIHGLRIEVQGHKPLHPPFGEREALLPQAPADPRN